MAKTTETKNQLILNLNLRITDLLDNLEICQDGYKEQAERLLNKTKENRILELLNNQLKAQNHVLKKMVNSIVKGEF